VTAALTTEPRPSPAGRPTYPAALGARVCGRPAHDAAFGTADLHVRLAVADIPTRVLSRLPDGAR